MHISKTIIGIGSVDRGAGTTCVCLAFANYLCNKMGMKTAYIELNTTNQINSLSSKDSEHPFVYMGIHIFPSTKVTSLKDILSKDFDYFILDMGILTTYTAVEFSKCQKQFLVCNFCEWKKRTTQKKIQDLFQNTNLEREKLILLKTFASKSTGPLLSEMHFKTFPPISNPFQLPVNLFSDLNNLLF